MSSVEIQLTKTQRKLILRMIQKELRETHDEIAKQENLFWADVITVHKECLEELAEAIEHTMKW
jgi:hypothetical protein